MIDIQCKKIFLPIILLKQDISDTFAGFGAFGLDEMGVDIVGGAHLAVAEHVGNRHDINAVGNENGCGGMPEGVRIDMRQVMLLAEFA